MSLQDRRLYEFGPFRLEPAERRLLRDGEEVPLPPKAFDLLVMLVARSGHLVSKEDLFTEVWPGTFVEEASLSYTVSVLRKALQTGSDEGRYIDTVQKLGYRFTNAVRTVMVDRLEEDSRDVASASSLMEQKRSPTVAPQAVAQSTPWFGASWRRPAAIVAGVLLAAVAVGVLFRQARQVPAPQPQVVDVTLPGHIILTDWDHPIISPDGDRVAFTGLSEGRRQLWVRPLASSTPIPMPGTDGAAMPFWSPDGRSLAFFADRKLKKIDVHRGQVIPLCCDNFPIRHTFGAWGSSGVILFSNGPVYRVADTGGVPERATQLEPSRHEAWHNVVGFLSDGRRFVFFSDPPPPTYYVTTLHDPNQRRTLSLGTAGRRGALSIARNHLLYAEEGVVVAQPFDEQALTSRGGPLTLARTDPAPWPPRPSASGTGMIVFRSSWYPTRQLAWLRRRDGAGTSIGSPDVYTALDLSPTGTRAVVVKGGSGWFQNRDLWLADLTTGIFNMLTSNPGLESSPAWSPDGRRIAYHSDQFGVISPFVKDLDTGKEERLFEPSEGVALDDWTRNDQLVLRTYGKAIYKLPITGVRKLERLVDTPSGGDQFQVSPDGRWIAFNSNESNAWEVYVARFPDFTDKQRVSVAGGVQPKWRGNGRELFYLAPDGTMMVVQLGADGPHGFPRARPLFKTLLNPPSHQLSEFDVTSDGQRFLVLEPASTRPQFFTLLQNWTEANR
jgi:DNA-binding winged helix-turn-helix (wHTH) protein/Tol biopolymer transport system component